MSSEIQTCVKDKQIGCINGIFQLFDRHHFFAARQRGGHISKRTLKGANRKSIEPGIAAETGVQGKTVQVEAREERRDSSILSSPCSSTPSSLDQIKTTKPDLSVKTGVKDEERIRVMKHITSPRQPFQQWHDIRDVVKDSMYREARSLPLPAKDVAKDEGRRVKVMKHIDSPRPSLNSSPGKPLSTRIHPKFFEAPFCLVREENRDPCRFSYDGRELRETTLKSTIRHGEHPRLSLDSRVRCIRSQTRSDFLLQNLREGNEELGSHRRPSSVVAKLMGLDLEGFPESPISSSADSYVQHRQRNQETFSPKNNSSSPCSKPAKPISSSRLPLELAPWSRSDSSSPRQKTSLKSKETSADPQRVSVYSEVEKRITEIEVDKSGKDMRALKHILKSMQKTRVKLDNQAQELSVQQHNHPSPTEESFPPPRKCLSSKPKQSAIANNKEQKNLTPKKSNASYRLPSIQKVNKGLSTAVRTPKESEHVNGGQEPASLRFPKRRISIEKQSELSRVRRNQNKQSKEPESPNRRQNPKFSNQRQGNNHLSEISSEAGNYSKQGDTSSVQSESNNSLASFTDTEVTSTYHNTKMRARKQVIHEETNDESRLSRDRTMAEVAMPIIEQPSPVSVLDATFFIEDSPPPVKKTKSLAFGDHDVTNAYGAEWNAEELGNLPFSTEQNLGSAHNHKNAENIDSLFHKCMPLKSVLCEDDMNEIAQFYQSHTSDHQYITKILLASGIFKDLESVSTTAHLHPSSHLINPMLFHVLEQAEESSWPTYKGPPKIFFKVQLEQKIHRKNVFDTVNEILLRKLALEHTVMHGRNLSGYKILKELYAEMGHLRPESDCSQYTQDDELDRITKTDLKHEWEDWVEHHGELPSLVLDIERLIFKDLLTEVIGRGNALVHDRPRRHPRRLFSP
ncbi:unnamed protein product [Cuscuta campestris]|uniref:DUF4378 domain-containing protein n=1 Tax=Cuscuta campestris TaxID=132261 RepID=A0A484LUU7_9ASTE|nr:unnamed protein product [Cuscuta campestris]